MPRVPRVLGVDGCPGGWVGAIPDGSAVEWLFLPTARDVVAVDVDAIGIDIPIGLPERGPRECDLAARTRLGPARSSVFLVPPRQVVQTVPYAEANHRLKELTGKGLSKQTWALFERVREVDEVADDPRLVEVHPELSLRAMTMGAEVVRDPKHTARGVGQRLNALNHMVDAAAALADVPREAKLDDALDALAAAWSAQRWLQGSAEVLPDPPPYDARGRPMRIVV